jgi:hypothetical protein
MMKSLSRFVNPEKIDFRVIWGLLLVFIMIPMFHPLGIPVGVSERTKRMYNLINTLQAGDIVCFQNDLEWFPTSTGPAQLIILKHLLMKDVKIVIVEFESTAFVSTSKILEKEDPAKYGYVYGTDWVYLGFVPGLETGIAAFTTDVWRTTPTDYEGTPISQIPIMQNIRKAEDFKMVIEGNSYLDVQTWVVRHWTAARGVTTAMITGKTGVSEIAAYYPHQIEGHIADIEGAWEYEGLLGVVGEALKSSDIISMAYIAAIITTILGNYSWIYGKYLKQQEVLKSRKKEM